MSKNIELKIEELDKKMNKIIDKFKLLDDVNKNTQVLQKSIDDLNIELESIRKMNDENKKKMKDIKKQNDFLEAENKCNKQEIRELRNTIEEFCMQQKSNELEICGYPEGNIDNIKGSLSNIAKKNKINLDLNDIKSISRMSSKNGRPGNILILTSNKTSRDNILKDFKKLKLKSSDLGNNKSSMNIYFNESLTAYAKKLLYYARIFKKDSGWKCLDKRWKNFYEERRQC